MIILLFTGARNEAYDRLVLKHLSKEVHSAKFEKYETETSTTFTELLAVKYLLTSFGYILKNQPVQVNTDSSSAYCILSIGSSKPHLQNLATYMFLIFYTWYQINSSMDPKTAKLISWFL